MTEKWELIVDTPWAKKGTIFVKGIGPIWLSGDMILQKTPEERVAEWLCENINGWCPKPYVFFWKGEMITHETLIILEMSKKIIAAGLDPDKLEGRK